MPSNSALVSDVCAEALRAFYNAPQRGRWASEPPYSLPSLYNQMAAATLSPPAPNGGCTFL